MIMNPLDPTKRIDVYDDALQFDYRRYIYQIVSESKFEINGWKDAYELEKSKHQYLHCEYEIDQFKTWRFIENLSFPVKKELENKEPLAVTANLSVPSDTNFAHSHSGLSLLYYVNLDWRVEWSGETLFFTENCKDIIFASPYVPGRIIIFDGSIPHSIRPQTYLAPHYRFTLAIFFG